MKDASVSVYTPTNLRGYRACSARRALSFLVLLAVVVCAASCAAAERLVKPFNPSELSAYALDVDYNPLTHTAYVKQRVRYVNASADALGELFFHVHANAYADEDNPPVEASEMVSAYPEGFSPGGLEMVTASVEGRGEVGAFYSPTLYRFALDPPLESGGHIVIDMGYELTLPRCQGRFGWGEHTASLANCFPQAAVYEEGAFRLDPYYAIGDPFYTECADWSAVIRVPEGYTVASTGMEEDGVIRADSVRDFCAVISNRFIERSKSADGVRVTAYGWDAGFVDLALDTAVASLKVFNERFGHYPYPSLSVAQTDFLPGGMEYPGLAVVSDGLSTDMTALVVAHEVAHQWWYAVVGSDQIIAPFQDEALTEFSTFLYFEDAYGDQIGAEMLKAYGSRSAVWDAPPIASPVTAFGNMTTYSSVVYGEGAALLRDLRARAGDEAFFAALGDYYAANMYRNASAGDLIDAVRKHCGDAHADWFEEGLYW